MCSTLVNMCIWHVFNKLLTYLLTYFQAQQVMWVSCTTWCDALPSFTSAHPGATSSIHNSTTELKNCRSQKMISLFSLPHGEPNRGLASKRTEIESLNIQTINSPTGTSSRWCLKPISQLWFDYDTTTTRIQRKIDVHFLLALNGSRRAILHSRIAIVITALHLLITTALTPLTAELYQLSIHLINKAKTSQPGTVV